MLKKSIHSVAFKKLIKKLNIKINITEVDSNLSVLKLVEEKKVDAGVVNRVFGDTQVKKYKAKKTSIIYNPIKVRYAVLKGENGELITAIDNHLVKMKKDEKSVYYSLLKTTFDVTSKTVLPTWIKRFGIIILLMLLIFLIGNIILRHQLNLKTR